jgi:Probable molybdopterin binding domain
MMKTIKTVDAVGTVLAHDMTRIIPGEFKGVGFKKGHVVCDDDIPELLKIGKANLYVLDLNDNELHEDDAALRIAEAVCGDHLSWTEPREGKSAMVSDCDGLVKIDTDALLKINKTADIIVSTLKDNYPCEKGQRVAATRIIPLITAVENIEQAEQIAALSRPVLTVAPFRKLKVGGVVTGTEVQQGLVPDGFDKFVAKKFQKYGCEYHRKILVPDDPEQIAQAIHELKSEGCELIITTGGMSVDPDDVTKVGVRETGANVITYGSPVLPGAMFLYALLDDVPILGLPACVYYAPTTIYDLMLPRVLAGEPITEDTIAAMGHGGMCLDCKVCHFPNCSFGF